MSDHIFHIVDREVWTEAVRRGAYLPAGFAGEGFVHFSYAHQVRSTWQAYYAAVPNLFVVEVDAHGLDVRVENGFPHVYQEIPVSAAVGTRELDDPLFIASGRATRDR